MKLKTTLDKIGICTSMICLIHCFTVPLFIAFGLDFLHEVVDQEWIETSIICMALIIGCFSFLNGFLKHKQHFIPVLFIAGILLFINGETIPDKELSLVMSVSGSLVVAYAHFQNLKWST